MEKMASPQPLVMAAWKRAMPTRGATVRASMTELPMLKSSMQTQSTTTRLEKKATKAQLALEGNMSMKRRRGYLRMKSKASSQTS